MGNKASRTKVEVDDAKLSSMLASCGLGHCMSECCLPEEKSETEVRQATQLHEIDMLVRYAQAMSAHALLTEIKRIRDETGVAPDIVVLRPGDVAPPITKRTIAVRIDDHTPV